MILLLQNCAELRCRIPFKGIFVATNSEWKCITELANTCRQSDISILPSFTNCLRSSGAKGFNECPSTFHLRNGFCPTFLFHLVLCITIFTFQMEQIKLTFLIFKASCELQLLLLFYFPFKITLSASML